MNVLKRALVSMAAVALAMVAAGGVTTARGFYPDHMSRSYSGAWPVTISGTYFDNGTGCLTFSGNGTSGSASFVIGSQKYPYGSFVVSQGLIVVTITEPLYGQNGALMFIAKAKAGHIGEGVFEDVRGGSNFQFGDVVFGTKGTC
jgi:hypothetical protein